MLNYNNIKKIISFLKKIFYKKRLLFVNIRYVFIIATDSNFQNKMIILFRKSMFYFKKTVNFFLNKTIYYFFFKLDISNLPIPRHINPINFYVYYIYDHRIRRRLYFDSTLIFLLIVFLYILFFSEYCFFDKLIDFCYPSIALLEEIFYKNRFFLRSNFFFVYTLFLSIILNSVVFFYINVYVCFFVNVFLYFNFTLLDIIFYLSKINLM